jgi:hypothetical protein
MAPFQGVDAGSIPAGRNFKRPTGVLIKSYTDSSRQLQFFRPKLKKFLKIDSQIGQLS